MPKKNLLKELLKYNDRMNDKSQWSTWNKGPYSRFQKNSNNYARQILNIISKGDLISMLNEVLTKNEKTELSQKYIKALKEYGLLFSKTKQKQRHKLLRPLRRAKFSFSDVKSLGFKPSEHLWRHCLDESERNFGGRLGVSNDTKRKIDTHMESMSHPAANRYLIKCGENAQVRDYTFREMHDTFELKSEVPFSTFHKHANKKYKPPHRLSDLCDYCEHNKWLKQDVLTTASAFFDYEKGNMFELDDVANFFASLVASETFKTDVNLTGIIDDALTKIADIKTIEFHKQVADRQRKIYNSNRTDVDLLDTSIVIEIDYKQKIILGHNPRENNSDFYTRAKRSFLGFGVYYKKTDSRIACLNMDVVFEEDFADDAFSIIRSFDLIRKQTIFKEKEKNNYLIWTDCGSHFRCYELAHYFFVKLAAENIAVHWNMFAEKHGKNARDQHFSVISNYLHYASMAEPVQTSRDIARIINSRQTEVNQIRQSGITKPQDPIEFWTGILPPTNQEKQVNKQMKINRIRSYYNLQNVWVKDKLKLKSSVFSDLNYLIPLDSSIKTQSTNTPKSNIKNKNSISLNDMRSKQKFLEERLSLQEELRKRELSGKKK